MRFSSKKAFVESVEREHQEFLKLVGSVPISRYTDPGVWGDGWTVRDLLSHVTEWEQMFLGWFRVGKVGGQPAMPAPGFKWNETPRLNRAIWKKRRVKSVNQVLDDFETTFQQIVLLIGKLTEDELLTPGHFAWTGKYPLTTYLAPNTCSHYRFGTKVLKRWLKSC